jgi:hypothetical protein
MQMNWLVRFAMSCAQPQWFSSYSVPTASTFVKSGAYERFDDENRLRPEKHGGANLVQRGCEAREPRLAERKDRDKLCAG